MNIKRRACFFACLALWLLPDSANGQGSIERVSKPQTSKHVLAWNHINQASAGVKPDWQRLDNLVLGMPAQQVFTLLGQSLRDTDSLNSEANYLYRYHFKEQIQQCQLKIIFSRQALVEAIYWEPVGEAICRDSAML